MKWIKNKGTKVEDHSLSIDGKDFIAIGRYYNNQYWLVDESSNLGFLFNSDKKFLKLEKCKDYVEKEIKNFARILAKSCTTKIK